MTQLPRAICPLCSRSVAMRVGGELREHSSQPTPFPKKLCPASGMTLSAAKPRATEGTVARGRAR